MSESALSILVVEDELDSRVYLETALRRFGYQVRLAQDVGEALERLRAEPAEIAAVLWSLVIPNREGNETLWEIRKSHPGLPLIVLSGSPSPFDIVTAMKRGATDFLCKPVTHEDLRKAITRALDTQTVECLRPQKSVVSITRVFWGKSRQMEAIRAVLGRVGWSEEPVLIQGETGTGKEVIARELHANSPRAKRAFYKLNCAALPSELVESELFGYERGAFTGAFQRKPGIFEMADGGAILLDEIGDMDVHLQAKLLQVLQDHEFQRIGGKETVKVDVRVLAATHRDLEGAILEQQFREDLYYRLNVVNLQLPALRERREDIIELAEFLLKKHAQPGAAIPRITPDLRAAMLAWDWPGNVRELENFARKLLIFQNPDGAARELYDRAAREPAAVAASSADDLPAADFEPAGGSILEEVTKARQQAESDAILIALQATHWNRKQAATLLQIDYKALLYKMKKLGMDAKPTAGVYRGRPAVA